MAKVSINKPAPVEGDPNRATVTDKLGRTIVIKKIGALDRLHLFKAVGTELSRNEQYFGYATLASAVVELNGEPARPPRTELDIEFMVQQLGDEGLEAVAIEYAARWGNTEALNREAAKN